MNKNRVTHFIAGEDIDSGLYVRLDAANPGQVLIASDGTVATGHKLMGFTQYGGKSGEMIDVIRAGDEISGIAGALITYGTDDRLTVMAGGKLKPAAAGDMTVAHFGEVVDAADPDVIKVFANFATPY